MRATSGLVASASPDRRVGGAASTARASVEPRRPAPTLMPDGDEAVAAQTNAAAEAAALAAFAPPPPAAFGSVGSRLFAAGMASEARRRQWAAEEKLKRDLRELQLADCTFAPAITRRAASLQRPRAASPENRAGVEVQQRLVRLSQLQMREEARKLEQCTFHPLTLEVALLRRAGPRRSASATRDRQPHQHAAAGGGGARRDVFEDLHRNAMVRNAWQQHKQQAATDAVMARSGQRPADGPRLSKEQIDAVVLRLMAGGGTAATTVADDGEAGRAPRKRSPSLTRLSEAMAAMRRVERGEPRDVYARLSGASASADGDGEGGAATAAPGNAAVLPADDRARERVARIMAKHEALYGGHFTYQPQISRESEAISIAVRRAGLEHLFAQLETAATARQHSAATSASRADSAVTAAAAAASAAPASSSVAGGASVDGTAPPSGAAPASARSASPRVAVSAPGAGGRPPLPGTAVSLSRAVSQSPSIAAARDETGGGGRKAATATAPAAATAAAATPTTPHRRLGIVELARAAAAVLPVAESQDLVDALAASGTETFDAAAFVDVLLRTARGTGPRSFLRWSAAALLAADSAATGAGRRRSPSAAASSASAADRDRLVTPREYAASVPPEAAAKVSYVPTLSREELQRRKDARIARVVRDRDERELRECTFKPRINSGRDGAAGGDDHEDPGEGDRNRRRRRHRHGADSASDSASDGDAAEGPDAKAPTTAATAATAPASDPPLGDAALQAAFDGEWFARFIPALQRPAGGATRSSAATAASTVPSGGASAAAKPSSCECQPGGAEQQQQSQLRDGAAAAATRRATSVPVVAVTAATRNELRLFEGIFAAVAAERARASTDVSAAAAVAPPPVTAVASGATAAQVESHQRALFAASRSGSGASGDSVGARARQGGNNRPSSASSSPAVAALVAARGGATTGVNAAVAQTRSKPDLRALGAHLMREQLFVREQHRRQVVASQGARAATGDGGCDTVSDASPSPDRVPRGGGDSAAPAAAVAHAEPLSAASIAAPAAAAAAASASATTGNEAKGGSSAPSSRDSRSRSRGSSIDEILADVETALRGK
jgi:hypothetical protein